MTQFKLLTVEDVFDIPGRGLLVLPGPLVDSFASPNEIAVTLKLPNGQVRNATASITFHFQTPPPKEHRFAVILTGLAKSGVPIGTEVCLKATTVIDGESVRGEMGSSFDRCGTHKTTKNRLNRSRGPGGF